jgi:beta-N-acetylhexosaminidase
MAIKAFISGCEGLSLSAAEQQFFRREDPWGLILFRRNCDSPEQIKALIADFRACVGRKDAPVLIDQEGGRVQRLRPPHWPSYPPARLFGDMRVNDPLGALALTRLGARLMAYDLHALGINVDCAPVVDVPVKGAHDIIGDRAYSLDPDEVARFARASCEGLLAGGVLPVIKHIPGHGRAFSDSHEALPVVDASRKALQGSDFLPFRSLTDMPLAMTAHVVYTAIDPDAPATTSKRVISSVIRRHIGYDGLVMCDDLSMNALSGTLTERTHATFLAGCDMALHCNGKLDQMEEVAAATPVLAGKPKRRAQAALARIPKRVEPLDREAMLAMFQSLVERGKVASSPAFAKDHALSV